MKKQAAASAGPGNKATTIADRIKALEIAIQFAESPDKPIIQTRIDALKISIQYEPAA